MTRVVWRIRHTPKVSHNAIVAPDTGCTGGTHATDGPTGNQRLFGGWPVVVFLTGCTSPARVRAERLQGGAQLPAAGGRRPPQHWIDANDVRIRANPEMQCHWWTDFNDPTLTRLVQCAYQQNLTLREAAFRVMEARRSWPSPAAASSRRRRTPWAVTGVSGGGGPRIGGGTVPPTFLDQWNYGFNLTWELDFWGRLRRAITAADANLDASVYAYDDALVTLIGDMANHYMQVRTLQEQIRRCKRTCRCRAGCWISSPGDWRPVSGKVPWTWIRPRPPWPRRRPRCRRC